MHYFIWIYSHRIREFVIKFTIIRKIKNTKSKFIPQIDLMNYKISLKNKIVLFKSHLRIRNCNVIHSYKQTGNKLISNIKFNA